MLLSVGEGGRGFCAIKGQRTITSVVELKADDVELKRAKECYVGKLTNKEDVMSFQDTLFKEGFFSIKCTLMGGNYVLLKGDDVNDLPALIDKEKAWINACCLSHLFNVVGSFISLHPDTMNRKRLDIARGLISLTSLTRIDKIIMVKDGNEEFAVSLTEIPGGGEPWCEKEVLSMDELLSESDEEDQDSDDSDHRWLVGDEDGNSNSRKSWEEDDDVEWVQESLQFEPANAPFYNVVRKTVVRKTVVIQHTNQLTRREEEDPVTNVAASLVKDVAIIRNRGVVVEETQIWGGADMLGERKCILRLTLQHYHVKKERF
ncbi:hypothetical protein RIF29_29533 [Crotalaria pallida]|uniref:Uncharacterized protein n=1 Tax=Crotalaria pallida TaxID=3830 RepID=A0AAN9EFN4_CROPI